MGRKCSTDEKDDGCIKSFGRNTRREDTAPRHKCRWEDNRIEI
jgi:hypothetical protein